MINEKYWGEKEPEKNLINIDNILNAEIIEEPWEHAVIDNIINMPVLWENLSNGYIPSSIFLNVLSENKDKILEKYGRYRLRDPKEKTRVTWGVPIQSPGIVYPTHNDTSNKVWSLVIYLFPKYGNGTLLYDQDMKLVKEIEWKQGRGLAFSCDPKGMKSWHSYTNTTDQFRVSLNINIRTGKYSNWNIVKREYLHTIG